MRAPRLGLPTKDIKRCLPEGDARVEPAFRQSSRLGDVIHGGMREWLTAVRAIVARRSPAAKEYCDLCQQLDADGALTTSVFDILGSLIHMQVNRLMRSAPRAVELVIYDLLRRLYRSERARKGRA